MKKTAVEWLLDNLISEPYTEQDFAHNSKCWDRAKQMEKKQMLDFGEFIIEELEPDAQNREWVEERYNYFKSESDE